MIKKIYVASSWKNLRQPYVVSDLRDAGFEVYDFKNPAPGNHGFQWKAVSETPPPWSAVETRQVLDHPIAKQAFKFDFDAMHWADAVVMVQPCGISAALELGWAAGAGKLTIALLSDGHEPELMLKMADHLCVSMDEVLEALKRGKKYEPPTLTELPELSALFEMSMKKAAERAYDQGYSKGYERGRERE